MFQSLKIGLCVGLLMLGLQSSWAFALLGPMTGNGSEAWQDGTLGYQIIYTELIVNGGQVFLGDIGGPKNWAEGYRRNAPVLYYTVDSLFYNYFRDPGVNAIQQAFGIMNGVTNVDQYSTFLGEFPMTSQEINYTAQALGLTDLKSVTLHLLVEQMGLAQPERFTWTLHERNRLTGTGPPCPDWMQYLVVQRNFDPVASALNQLQYTPYVNGILYTYYIQEFCTAVAPSKVLAETVPFTTDTDPSANTYSSVAANNVYGLALGGYYTGLTRDDVAGLRNLLSTNTINTEAAAAGALYQNTNYSALQLLYPSNLTTLTLESQTNTIAGLQTLYPGLAIGSVSNYFALVVSTNAFIYLTNLPGSPFGTVSTVVAFTRVTNIQQFFSYTYDNVIIITNHPSTPALLQTITVAPPNGSPAGSAPVTTVSTKHIVLTNVPSGEFYILPAGSCGYDFIQTLQTIVTPVTNNIISTVNGNLSYSQSLITYFTNHVYEVAPCTLDTPPVGEYQGIGRVQFVYAPYDSLISQYFQPVTNTYSMVVLTNSHFVKQTFQRVVTTPDILFSAGDLATGPSSDGFNGTVVRTDLNFAEDPNRVGSTTAYGPGVINSPSVFTFNKVGPSFYNTSYPASSSLIPNESSGIQGLIWASFDGTTNAPTVYPNGSYTNVLAAVLVQINPTSLPNGTNNVAYGPITFTATGGSFTPQFSWTASGLPPNLQLSSGGTLSGTPTQSGTFNSVLRLTDVNGRTMQWVYPITIQ